MTSVYPFDFAGSAWTVPTRAGMTAIYGLFDPGDGALRYVGKTRHLAKRLCAHCYAPNLRSATHRNHWLRNLVRTGQKPSMRVLLWLATEESDDAERAYIAEARRQGHSLTNIAPGGTGNPVHAVSALNRAKTAAQFKGKTLTPEHRAKISAAVKAHWKTQERRDNANVAGRTVSPEGRAKISASRRGRTWSPAQHLAHKGKPGHKHTAESRAKLSAAHKGKIISVAARQRSSEAHRGKALPAEQRAKIAAALTGYKRRPKSDEQRAAISQRLTGKKQSPETIAKRVEKVRATWERKRREAGEKPHTA